MKAEEIIKKYYDEGSELYRTLIMHSRAVADKALECARRKNLDVDLQFVEEAAMLHDIGVFRCHAPSIYCEGELPYICHGIEGRKILEAEGLPHHALVCERHTGAGLTIEDIESQNLPLPHRDMTPRTLEEKLICYADKFFSKSGALTEEKPLEKVRAQLAAHGPATLHRFDHLHSLFS